MLSGVPSRRNAVIMAFLCTTIWSSTWILARIGLKEMDALPFAALRYVLAFVMLLPWMFRKNSRETIRRFSKKEWLIFAGLGLLSYPINQGAIFLAMTYLPNTTISLITNMSPILLAILGGLFLNEKLDDKQYLGIAVTVAGALVFFLPMADGKLNGIGVLLSFITLFANVIQTIIVRKMLKSGDYPALLVTVIPMGFGAILMGTGTSVWEWIPRISLTVWGVLLVLSLVNTAIAFTLWNVALQRLTAVEANVISNTMLVQVAILSWIFLGDVVTWKMAAGMGLVIAGVVMVNLWKNTAISS
jgi:drug/metabolite transporter (DMT)-like permease